MKNTPARRAILYIFQKNKNPLAVDQVIKKLEKTKLKVDRVTVFRNINLLLKNKILCQMEFNEGKYRYELASLPHHHHLICTSCKKITGIKSDSLHREIDLLKKRVDKEYDFEIKDHKLEFFGRCKKCQKKETVKKI